MEIFTQYIAADGTRFRDKYACEIYEENLEKRRQSWAENSPRTKFDKLVYELEKAYDIHPDTIATCSFTSLQIKGMVKVCQKFAEENKEYLNYY